MTTGITELVFAAIVIAAVYFGRGLITGWLSAKTTELEIDNREREVALQPKIKAVKDKQEAMISKHGKWLTLDDLNQI